MGLLYCIGGLDLRGVERGDLPARHQSHKLDLYKEDNSMVAKKKPDTTEKEPKDLRYRNLYFPGADKVVFDTGRKGFVPLPIILRKILWYLTPPELRVLIYLILRASKYGICYPTLEEIAYDLGMKGRKNLTPHLRSLETRHFIKTHTASGKKFFLIHDPRVAIERLVQAGAINEGRFYEINELLGDLNQEEISKLPKKHPDKQA
jgi:hypothetical protein